MKPTRPLTVLAAASLATAGVASTSAASPPAPTVAAPTSARTSVAMTVRTGTHTMSVTKTLSPTGRTMKAGGYATFTGKVTSGRRSTSVYFQHYQGGKFVTIATGSVSSTGSFAVRGQLTAPGTRKVRIVIPGNSYWKTYTSYASTMKVYKWHYLSDLDWASSNRMGVGSDRVNGTYYTHSLRNEDSLWWGTPWAEVDLRRTCSILNAKVGQSDLSARTDGVIAMEVSVDGARKSQDILRFGQMVNRTVSVSGGLRLRVQSVRVGGSDDFDIVWGDAKVLCMW